jgi:hypothetical chaperone protein
MFAGFDYGTSNCAIGVMEQVAQDKTVRLLPINGEQPFMPSVLYALERELICDVVGQNISDPALQNDYIAIRKSQLAVARRVRLEQDILPTEQWLFVGQEAFEQYMAFPEEGYFVKSPKSFLGATGLPTEFVNFLEDIVAAMMQTIKQRAEHTTGESIEHAVIGRPVNFQGINAEESNRQAIEILSVAAQRAGLKSVEFLFEPLAAGFDFEARLLEDKTVLVVDVGGGTTDCAMVRMGPGHRDNLKRTDDFLGHSGERIGGNDLDIQLAGYALMPLFGMHSVLKNGQPMPTQSYWNAVKTNDVGAQSIFNSQNTQHSLKQLLLDTTEPHLLKRFIKIHNENQNHQLVRSAEQCKIALSDQQHVTVNLDYIEKGLHSDISQQEFADDIQSPLVRIIALMEETIKQAGCRPDLVYVTGGTAKSPAIQEAIKQKLGAIDVVDGDHFGSVAAGLTIWAQRLFS